MMNGVVQGQSQASEELQSLREEIKRLKASNSRLREDLKYLLQFKAVREVYR